MAKKDFNLPKHGEIDTKNLYVGLDARFPCLIPMSVVLKLCLHRKTLLPGDQSLPVAHFAWLLEDAIFLAMVLLHPDTGRP